MILKKYVNESQCDGCEFYTGFHPHMLGSDNYAFCKTSGKTILKLERSNHSLMIR